MTSMIQSIRMYLFVGLVFSLMSVAGCSTIMGRSRLVTGYVQSMATDENDHTIEVFLWDGKSEYRVTKNKQQKQLLDLVDKKVAARGSVFNDWNGKTQIEVESFEILEER